MRRVDVLNRKVADPPTMTRKLAGSARPASTAAAGRSGSTSSPVGGKKARSRSREGSPGKGKARPSDDFFGSGSPAVRWSHDSSHAEEGSRVMDELRRVGALAFSLEVDLKAEKRVTDELKKEAHQLRLHTIALETRTQTMREAEAAGMQRVEELRGRIAELEDERARREGEVKCQLEERDAQIEKLQQEAQECRCAQERDVTSRAFQTAMLMRDEEMQRHDKSLAGAQVLVLGLGWGVKGRQSAG